MDAIAYRRVSGDEQARSGLGMDAQRTAIEEAAAARGWTIAEEHWISDEGVSGKSLSRPGIQRALELLEDGGPDLLVVAKLDRLSRSAIDFLTVIDRAQREGWALAVLDLELDTTTPMGRFTATVMAGIAELERELISQRTKDALAAARERGVRLGAPPLVSTDVADRIVRERRRGVSYGRIAEGLNRDGVPTTRGGQRWYASTVRVVAERAGRQGP